MTRDAQWYLTYLVEQIHTTVVATVDDDGLPVTAAIDMMAADERGLYFLTARGKAFYDRLVSRGYLALTGLRGEDTMSTVAISVRGRVEEVGPQLLPWLFERNPYMATIYPTEESRKALTVFCLSEGSGEWFDLSVRPIDRASFVWGGAGAATHGYQVDADACIGCGLCVEVCPQDCIDLSSGVAVIAQDHCLHCGNCQQACPIGAVSRS